LTKLCANINSKFNSIEEVALRLSDYAIAPRYPDAFDDLTIEDAKEGYADATFIKTFILKNFI